MSKMLNSASPVPVAVTRQLVAAAEKFFRLAPWRFMSDLHLVGLRDEVTGELRVASVMGALGEVFGVGCYRGAAGLGWLHAMATSDEASTDSTAFLEGLDCLKVEWTKKQELSKPDLDLLANAGFKPPGRGSVWPKFQSAAPGWYPWFVNETEARQLRDDLGKLARLAELFAQEPDLFDDCEPGEIAVVPAGERPLRREEINWTPLLPPPSTMSPPAALSADEEQKLAALPMREDFVFEFTAQLVPELAFMDAKAGRPCIPRAALMSDRRSYFIFASELCSAAAPLGEAAAKSLVKGLLTAKVRPGAIHADTPALVAVLTPACATLGVRVEFRAELKAAHDAIENMASHFGGRHGR